MNEDWASKAALYELLAKSFLFTGREVSEALVSGEYADALAELACANGLTDAADVANSAGAAPADGAVDQALAALAPYRGADADATFHALRQEYTRLYVGAKDPLITPYAGVHAAQKAGQKAFLFVGKESMAIERFMRDCGMVKAAGPNDPLDHIGSMLEFLMHLCSVKAGIVSVPEGPAPIPEDAYERFYREHFSGFARDFAEETRELSGEGFYRAAALVLRALPQDCL